MNQEQITEGSKIIAEWVGIKCYAPYWNDSQSHLNSYFIAKEECDKLIEASPFLKSNGAVSSLIPLNYDTSWNDLMPVVEKIRTTENGEGGCYSFNWHDYQVWFSKWPDGSGIISKATMISGTTPIQATWLAVVDFIKWHNKQKA